MRGLTALIHAVEKQLDILLYQKAIERRRMLADEARSNGVPTMPASK